MPTQERKPSPRIEYRGFRQLDEQDREFLFAVGRQGAWEEVRFTVALTAMSETGIHLQDLPSVCYRTLANALAESRPVASAGRLGTAELQRYHLAEPPPRWRSFATLGPTGSS